MTKFLPFLFATVFCTSAHSADPAGFWKGEIELPGGNLGIEVTLDQKDKAWSGTITIPAQGLRNFDLADVASDNDGVKFSLPEIPGDPAFAGKLAEDGESIEGTFSQGGGKFPARLRRSEKKGDAGPAIPDKPVPGDGFAGEWLGVLKVGPAKLRLAFHASGDGKEGLSGVLESIDQGSTKVTATSVSQTGKDVGFEIADGAGGTFKGKLNEDGSAIDGIWSQGGKDFPLKLHRLEKAFVLKRPQDPKAPFPYAAKDVTFPNKDAKIQLAGTLILPKGDGPFPAVLFVSGSGPQNRDEELMGHKPFWVIADYLARRGIASLRYDDRGVGKSGGNHMGSTVTDFAKDAEAGIAYLAALEKIDRAKIGIVGHSEGGLQGPIAAANVEEISFLVLLAPPGEALDKLIARQADDQRREMGIPEDLIKRASEGKEEDIALIRDASIPGDELKVKLKENAEKWKKKFTADELQKLGFNEAAIEQSLNVVTTPWFRSLMGEDPAVHLSKIKIPVLALIGEKDVQVDAEVNAPLIEEALKKAGNKDFEVKILPGLNHLFQHCETGAISEYSTIEETFSPEVLKLIGDWINKRYGEN